jgi:predicted phosphate transport protein (TIGR00153 family)
MGTLLDWFRSRREQKIINQIKEHAKKTYNCVVLFKDALTEFFKDDMKGAKKIIKRVNQVENECDVLRRAIMDTLTRGELAPQVRNDLAHLIGRLDNVANSANASARRLGIITPQPLEIVYDALLEMVDKTILCAEVLRDAIEIEISGAIEEVNDSIIRINRIEHEIDQLHYNVLEKLTNTESTKEISHFMALNIYELIENIEQISDYCEATADFVKIINLRVAEKNP